MKPKLSTITLIAAAVVVAAPPAFVVFAQENNIFRRVDNNIFLRVENSNIFRRDEATTAAKCDVLLKDITIGLQAFIVGKIKTAMAALDPYQIGTERTVEVGKGYTVQFGLVEVTGLGDFDGTIRLNSGDCVIDWVHGKSEFRGTWTLDTVFSLLKTETEATLRGPIIDSDAVFCT